MVTTHAQRPGERQRTLCGRRVRGGVVVADAGAPPTCRTCLRVAASNAVSAPAAAGLLALTPRAVVFVGSPLACSRPATVDLQRILPHTPEGRVIVDEDVAPGSGRGRILWNQLYVRLREVVGRAARRRGTDCVVRLGDVADAAGRPVADLTEDVIELLG